MLAFIKKLQTQMILLGLILGLSLLPLFNVQNYQDTLFLLLTERPYTFYKVVVGAEGRGWNGEERQT